MYLQKLSLINFKNHAQHEFELSPGLTCFVGKNGSGKTNVLDAVHYLSMCKSYLNPVDRQNIRFGEHFFVLQGFWEDEGTISEIYCGVKSGQKKIFRKNKVEYERLADHIGKFPSVVISPYDRDLIAEGSEIRRKWMDGIISQSDKVYLETLIRYMKVLDHRNALLKKAYENGFLEPESLQIWDEQLIPLGQIIHQKRQAFIQQFIPVFNRYYSFIGNEEEQVSIEYRSALNETDFEQLLYANKRKDAHAQYTTSGIHKDDLIFSIHENPIKKFGSQGQQKSFIIALKLAQFDWLAETLAKKPLLMLDDIFDKLDQFRVQKLVQLVSDNVFGQVLITDTDKERIERILSGIQAEKRIIELETIDLIHHG